MIIYLDIVDVLTQEWNRHLWPSILLTTSNKQLLVSVLKWQLGSLNLFSEG